MFPMPHSPKSCCGGPPICPVLVQFFATLESLCVLSSHPEGDRPENSVRNGDLLLAESVLQVVVVFVGDFVGINRIRHMEMCILRKGASCMFTTRWIFIIKCISINFD